MNKEKDSMELSKILDNKWFNILLFIIFSTVLLIIRGIDIHENKYNFHTDSFMQKGLLYLAIFSLLMALIRLLTKDSNLNTCNKEDCSIIDSTVLKLKNKNFKDIRKLLYSYVNETELDFLAYYDKTKKEPNDFFHYANPNLFDRLKIYEIDKTPEELILEYDSLAKDLYKIIDKLNDTFKELEQDILVRTVFDVKKGGIFYYHIDDDRYIFGATVNQDSMDDNSADVMMRDIKKKIKEIVKG